MSNDRIDNIGISSNGSEQQEVMIENVKDTLSRIMYWMKRKEILFGKMESIFI